MDSDDEFVYNLVHGFDEPEVRPIPESFIDPDLIVSSDFFHRLTTFSADNR